MLYAAAPELFDTAYRGSASGMLSCMGRLAGIVAPFAGESKLSFAWDLKLITLQVRNIWLPAVQVSCGLALVVSGCPL